MSLPYVMKDKFIQVTVDGKAFAMDDTHQYFGKIKAALKAKDWKKATKFIALARLMVQESEGAIAIVKGRVTYKGKEIKSTLSARIVELIFAGKPVKHLLRFMDNLYKNPSQEAIEEFYSWLVDNDLPITDDGCFLAYKSVDNDNLDTYSRSVRNLPGMVIMMPRNSTDLNYRMQCSQGFHICSKQYGLYGTKVLAVKANPKDVVAANGGKIRVWKYEIIADLGSISRHDFQSHGFSSLEKQLVIEVKKERKEMLQILLKDKGFRRFMRKHEMTVKNVLKGGYGRIKRYFQLFSHVPPAIGPEDKMFLLGARKSSGLTVGQLAKQLGVSYKSVVNLEKSMDPSEEKVSNYLEAIAFLKKSRYNAISYRPNSQVG